MQDLRRPSSELGRVLFEQGGDASRTFDARANFVRKDNPDPILAGIPCLVLARQEDCGAERVFGCSRKHRVSSTGISDSCMSI